MHDTAACYGLLYCFTAKLGLSAEHDARQVSKILNWITSSITLVLWGMTVDGSATTNSTGMETCIIGARRNSQQPRCAILGIVSEYA